MNDGQLLVRPVASTWQHWCIAVISTGGLILASTIHASSPEATDPQTGVSPASTEAQAQSQPQASFRSILADLTPTVRQTLQEGQAEPLDAQPAWVQLDAVFAAATPYEFDGGLVVAYTDKRWFSTYTSTGPAAPLLELRRWPGDTVLSLYNIAGPLSSERNAQPPAPGSGWTLRDGATEIYAEWDGVIDLDLGERPAMWIEMAIGESKAFLGAMILPGDAGLGEAAVPDLIEEARGVLSRIVVREDLWRRKDGLPHGVPIDLSATNAMPRMQGENTDPWQVALGSDFTIGIPPGVRVRRMDAGVPPPLEVDGGLLWLRGHYTDVEGEQVIIGDDRHAGYIAEVEAHGREWLTGDSPPLGVPSAIQQASEPFPLLRDKEHVGAKGGRALRFTTPDFSGSWLVFRIDLEQRGIEIGLPVVKGRRSASLFWIPATFRGNHQSPAPPPVDPAERFGIKFERLSRHEKTRRPWMEGFLSIPGLRVELPKGWWPSAALRSTAGFPIRLVNLRGMLLGALDKMDPESLHGLDAEGSPWQALPRPGIHRAAGVYRRAEDDARLFVAKEGWAFKFVIVEPERVTPEEWDRMAKSVQLLRLQR